MSSLPRENALRESAAAHAPAGGARGLQKGYRAAAKRAFKSSQAAAMRVGGGEWRQVVVAGSPLLRRKKPSSLLLCSLGFLHSNKRRKAQQSPSARRRMAQALRKPRGGVPLQRAKPSRVLRIMYSVLSE